MKSRQPNTSEQPPSISASNPRDNPCLGSDSTIAALDVFADDGISYLLPYAQFLYAEKIPTRHWKKSLTPRRKRC